MANLDVINSLTLCNPDWQMYTGSRGEGGVLPYMGYIGMCGHKGYGFSVRFGHKLVIDFSHFAAIWS